MVVLTQRPQAGMEGWLTGNVPCDGAEADGERLDVGEDEGELDGEELWSKMVLLKGFP